LYREVALFWVAVVLGGSLHRISWCLIDWR